MTKSRCSLCYLAILAGLVLTSCALPSALTTEAEKKQFLEGQWGRSQERIREHLSKDFTLTPESKSYDIWTGQFHGLPVTITTSFENDIFHTAGMSLISRARLYPEGFDKLRRALSREFGKPRYENRRGIYEHGIGWRARGGPRAHISLSSTYEYDRERGRCGYKMNVLLTTKQYITVTVLYRKTAECLKRLRRGFRS